jgi:hypothetical protein
MKPTTALAIMILGGATFCADAKSAPAVTPAQAAFEQMKSLAGEWQGKNNKGEPSRVSYSLGSNGSAVLADIKVEHLKQNMISMIHLDGGRVMITHYCSEGNQPRMAASHAEGNSIAFEFVDATNLASPTAGRMQRVVFTFLDADHHTEDWTFRENGKDMKESFTFERVHI